MLLDTLVVENSELLWKATEFVLADQNTNKPKKKKENKTKIKKLQCSFVSLLQLNDGSKEESSHPPADALSVVQDVELVDELVHTVAGLGDGT